MGLIKLGNTVDDGRILVEVEDEITTLGGGAVETIAVEVMLLLSTVWVADEIVTLGGAVVDIDNPLAALLDVATVDASSSFFSG